MKTVGKVVLSIVAVMVLMLVSAAVIEVSFGEQRPGFTQLLLLALAGPVLYLIWRKRAGRDPA